MTENRVKADKKSARSEEIEKLDNIRKRLGLTYKKISELSGVPLSTVQKVMSGNTESPRMSTLEALRNLLMAENLRFSDDGDYPDRPDASANDSSSISHRSCLFTVHDLERLPDDNRVELIHGVIYDMASPNTVHQILVTEIWSSLRKYINDNHGSCIPMLAPYDVQILKDDFNMLVPDVLVVCDKNKLTKKNLQGAPDLIIEVTSPSSVKYDRITKLSIYSEANVREYWIVDPVNKVILVYHLEKTYISEKYSFTDIVPVGIFDGRCKVDFGKISEYISNIIV
ncbi:MAG: Uma2 family endonuclease [Lachnospiraceae bacterium]|jgi:Uma2 family endonuclease|nr:Uma2 family endonuclease [Lachnospiraceae bacterium]MEE3462153.1 Uma2 family endonuclease [Lachnospiraceae bacterium]